MTVHCQGRGASIRVAHASRVLVSASRQNSLSSCSGCLARNALRKVRDCKNAFASTRDARATRITRP
jgi:hypothetical protein